jgi:ligand-binding sensor domain-containing protein
MKKTVYSVVNAIIFLGVFFHVNSFERFINYGATIGIHDFAALSNNLFVGSTGGLYIYDKNTQKGILCASNNASPDPAITAVCISDKYLWTGSDKGYLCKRRMDGSVIATTVSYFASGWKITDLYPIDKYLLVASDKGLSLFNTESMTSEKNVTKFGIYTSTKINTLTIFKDTLFLALDNGIAKTVIGTNVAKVNLYDPAIWQLDSLVEKPVRSFIIGSNCSTSSAIAVKFRNYLINATQSELFSNGKLLHEFESAITSLFVADDILWIGTEKNYLYSWDGVKLLSVKIPGPTMNSINKLYVDNISNLWFLPYAKGHVEKDNVGIGYFNGNNWNVFPKSKLPGTFGDDLNHLGITQTKNQQMWFGLSGGAIKIFSEQQKSWQTLCFNYENRHFEIGSNCADWGKCDAIVEDRIPGYIWISIWRNGTGGLICYDYRNVPSPDTLESDPLKAHYKRYFPTPDGETVNLNFISLNIDSSGNLIACSDKGKVYVISHNGNPLQNINIEFSKTDLGDIIDAVVCPDNITRIISSKGLYELTNDNNKYSITLNSKLGQNLNSIAAENNNILWFGTTNNGLIRYDILADVQTSITESKGLVSNDIRDIVIDKKSGYLWVATENGFSSLDLGAKIDGIVEKSDIQVFPNPFSKSKNKMIYIRNIASGSNVAIYSINGRLVARPALNSTGSNESYIWNVANTINAGTYFVFAGNGKNKTMKKVLITP